VSSTHQSGAPSAVAPTLVVSSTPGGTVAVLGGQKGAGVAAPHFRTPSGAVIPLALYDPAVHGVGPLEVVPQDRSEDEPVTPRSATLTVSGPTDAHAAPSQNGAPLPISAPLPQSQGHGRMRSMNSELASPAPLDEAAMSISEQGGAGGDDVDCIGDPRLSLQVPPSEGSPFVLPSLRATASPGTEPFLPLLSSALMQQYSRQQDRSLVGAYAAGPSGAWRRRTGHGPARWSPPAPTIPTLCAAPRASPMGFWCPRFSPHAAPAPAGPWVRSGSPPRRGAPTRRSMRWAE
jgi:hypothetical protein